MVDELGDQNSCVRDEGVASVAVACDENNSEPSQGTAAQDEKQVDEGDSSEREPVPERQIRRLSNLTHKLKELQDCLEVAVAENDNEKATELEESLQKVLDDLQLMSLTNEDFEKVIPECPALALPIQNLVVDDVEE